MNDGVDAKMATSTERRVTMITNMVGMYVYSPSVSAQTRNLPVLELAFPFPVLAPISSTVLF